MSDDDKPNDKAEDKADEKPAGPPPTGQPAGVPEKPTGERSLEDKPVAERTVQDKSLHDNSLVVSDDPGPLPHQDLEVVDVRTGMFGVAGSGDTSGYGGLVRPVAIPGRTSRPYGGWFDAAADRLDEVLEGVGVSGAVTQVVLHRGEITFHVDRELLVPVMQNLRDDPALRFEFCSGVSGVHYPHEAGAELHAVYHLMSMTHNRRIRVEVTCPDSDPHIPSVVSIYPTNDWHERETFDFFGIVFDGHPALTRIEMPDDWPGHPQRKDYPLGGIPVEYKGATIPPPDKRRSYN
ncbi:MAG: NADH-quinone oxidoreductase subunit [Nocardioidaceae bacterium]|nr:NADH-quinone oxidoreductase subunit [Nocardioidaceae bacterium]